ncbi:MAG: thiol:disulfide interchange protein DsbA [Cocleimonas sp.]|jgi:thiol:disulfide interchange protein DsbA
MYFNFKLTLLSVFITLFVSAYDASASTDVNKIEIKQGTTTSVTKAPESEPVSNTANVQKDDAMKLSSSEFIEGKHYIKILPAMSTDVASGKIEVAELFWFGCPHCYSMEPDIVKYKANHPEYVEFKQVPAMHNPSWAADANTFFIASILDPKESKDLVTKVFDSIHKHKRRLRSPKAVVRFFVEQGYTEEQISEVRKSMAFQTKLVRAQEFTRGSQANSVPTMVVNGKYRTSPSMAGGNQKAMEVVAYLTKKENDAK